MHGYERRTRLSAMMLASVTLLLSGCASFSSDGGFGAVEQTTKQRLGKDVKWARGSDDRAAIDARVAELIKHPLSVDDAVQVALLNNRGLQASFAELGIAEADLVQAGRLPNPRLSYVRAHYGNDYTIEQAFTFNVFSLVTRPLAREAEQRRLARTQRLVAMEVLRVANETRVAYVDAIASRQGADYMAQVQDAAEAGGELARRMVAAGNWSELQAAREREFEVNAIAQAARAKQSAVSANERLTRLLGLDAPYQLPERLPDLPASPKELPNVEQLAMGSRLDLQAVRLETEALAKDLGLTKTTRFVNVIELGAVRKLEGERSSPYKNGYEISFELPLFDWGSARVGKAEAIYRQALDRAAEAATNARSEVREGYQGYRTAYDLARRYRDDIVPLRQRISQETQLRYNGMLVSIFDLLADARAQTLAVNGYIGALRDFWLADTNLDMALIGKPMALLTTMTSSAASSTSE